MLAAAGSNNHQGPTPFAGASEYDRSFKWVSSYKSANFSPTGEQLRPTAGIESLRRHVVMEPPLQRKKRIDTAPRESVQLGAPDTPTEDSFLVAGQKSEMFSPSKMHPNYAKEAHKRRSQSLAAQREQEQQELELRRRQKEEQHHQQLRQAAQKRQRQADEEAAAAAAAAELEPPAPPTPDAPREVKRQLTVPARARRGHHHRRRRSISQDAVVSTKELESQLAKARREARRLEADALMKRQEEDLGDAGEGRKASDAAAVPYQRSKTPPYYKDYENKDHYAVHDADYAKKRQLGLADAKRPLGNKPTKETEYQTRYAAPVQPAQTAANVRRKQMRQELLRSHAGLPHGGGFAAAVPSTTEYRRQFQAKNARVAGPARRGATKQPPPPPRVSLDGREYRPKDALNPQRVPGFPLGAYAPVESEYRKSFAAGASVGEAEWQRRLREARELRQRAAQYRLRSYGTHFSRQHLAQVYAPNGSLEAWQPVATARSEGDADDYADDLEAEVNAVARRRPRTAPSPHPQAAWDSDAEDGEDFAEPDVDADAQGYDSDQDVARSQRRHRDFGRGPHRRSASASAPNRRRARSAGPRDHSPSLSSQQPNRRRLPESEVAGRFATPRLRDERQPGQGYSRHHFDRTTPNYGGVLVGRPNVYPPSEGEVVGNGVGESWAAVENGGVVGSVEDLEAEVADPRENIEEMGRPFGGRKPIGRLIKESRQLLAGAGGKRRRPVRQNVADMPPAGLPTRDIAPLLDEAAPNQNVPIPLSPDRQDPQVRQQQQQQQQQHQQRQAYQQIYRRRDEPRVSGAAGVDVPTPQQQQQQQPPLDDGQFSDGFFSDTASLMSSSTMSLGSETLERAKKRQDAFWGRK